MIVPVERETYDRQGHITALAYRMQKESPAYRDYAFDLEQFNVYLNLCTHDPDWRACVYYNKSDPIGFYAVTCQPMLFSKEKTCDDLAWYVLPEHRGSTAGIRMLRDIIWWAGARGAREIRMGATTNIMDERVGKLLATQGFCKSGQLHSLQLA
jgi:GNAT superfamily N-acetyltransferase